MLSCLAVMGSVRAEDIVGVTLNEMELVSDLSIGDKSFAYFNLLITSNESTEPTEED